LISITPVSETVMGYSIRWIIVKFLAKMES